jgi:hypothetical protein
MLSLHHHFTAATVHGSFLSLYLVCVEDPVELYSRQIIMV